MRNLLTAMPTDYMSTRSVRGGARAIGCLLHGQLLHGRLVFLFLLLACGALLLLLLHALCSLQCALQQGHVRPTP